SARRPLLGELARTDHQGDERAGELGVEVEELLSRFSKDLEDGGVRVDVLLPALGAVRGGHLRTAIQALAATARLPSPDPNALAGRFFQGRIGLVSRLFDYVRHLAPSLLKDHREAEYPTAT